MRFVPSLGYGDFTGSGTSAPSMRFVPSLFRVGVAAALSIAAISQTSCGAKTTEVISAPSEQTLGLSRAQMKKDAQFWYRVVQEVHPAPYSRISRKQMEREMQKMIESLPQEADPLEFVIGLTSLASWMRDSHTSFSYPEHSAAYDEPLFRYQLAIDHGELLWVSEADDVSIPIRAPVTRINDVDASEIVQWLRRSGIGELDGGIERSGTASAPAVLWAHGVRAPFVVQWLDGSKQAILSEVPGKMVGNPHPPKKDSEALTAQYTEDNVAVLTLTSMPDPDELFPLAEQVFNDISEREPQALIIDIRQNGGGTTEAADMIFGLITDKNYRLVGAKHWRVSERYKKVVREQYGGVVAEYETAKNGELLILEGGEYVPEDYGYRYDGPVALLIGPDTASAAMMMANAAEDYDLAVLIGAPTSSPPNYFGEVYSFTLPESGIEAGTSVAYFVRANGDESTLAPVKPDIHVKTTEEDHIAGRDPVMEAALDWATAQIP